MSSELSCPSVSDLQTLLQGLASEADTERWTEHLEHCERCQETARALQAGPQDELIVALANSQASLEPVLSDTTVAPLIDRMKSISRQATQTPTTFIVPANGSGSSVGETVAPDYWGLLDPPIQPDELGRLV